MTTYKELAKTPQAFDTELARLHDEIAKAQRTLQHAMDNVFKAAGARRKSTRNGLVWDASYDAAHVKVLDSHPELITAVHEARKAWRAIENEIQAMDRAYTGWTRFFPSITKSHPHIHRSLHCHTLHPTTQMAWAPQLSGKTDEEAVAELDEALCSVCFPTAPVALHEYVSKRSQAERTEREVAKLLRDEKKAQTQLTEDEQAQMGRDRHGDRVTTVAKLREMVRDEIELEVEIEFWATHSPEGWDADNLARRRQNLASDLVVARERAAMARMILQLRERNHTGHGSTAEDIARMQDKKRKSATREWNKN